MSFAPTPTTVIPAKAGTHLVQMPSASQPWDGWAVQEMGPRFRGDDESAGASA